MQPYTITKSIVFGSNGTKKYICKNAIHMSLFNEPFKNNTPGRELQSIHNKIIIR